MASLGFKGGMVTTRVPIRDFAEYFETIRELEAVIKEKKILGLNVEGVHTPYLVASDEDKLTDMVKVAGYSLKGLGNAAKQLGEGPRRPDRSRETVRRAAVRRAACDVRARAGVTWRFAQRQPVGARREGAWRRVQLL